MPTEIPANGWKAQYDGSTSRGNVLFVVTGPVSGSWDVMITMSDRWIVLGENEEKPTPDELDSIRNAVVRTLIGRSVL